MAEPDRDAPLHGFVRELTAMGQSDDAHPVYQAWAPSYESDLIEGYGYCAHRIGALALCAHFEDNASRKRARILDLGCGTGLVGQELAAAGFGHIEGFDASANMLAEAREKALYQALIQGDLRDPEALPESAYDAAIAVGVFGGGHVGPESLACFIRPVRAGGTVVLFANGIPFIEDDYEQHLRQLEADGWCKVQRITQVNYMDRINRPGFLVEAIRGSDATGEQA